MSAGAISSSLGTNQVNANPYASLTSSEFIRIMLTELQNQDPLSPQDSGKLLEQFSSLRNIESQLQLQDKLEALVLQNQVAAAGGLIGKIVSGIDEANLRVEGLVTSVRVQSGQAYLELDTGKIVPMSRVTEISEATAG